jgi:hypothetical protein
MKRVSYVKDSSGAVSGIVIDINVWNAFLTFNPDAMHFIVGNTFENNGPMPLNSIFNPAPKPEIVPKDFPNDISEMKN